MERYDLNAVPNASSEKAGVLRVANSVDEKNSGCTDAAITPSNLYSLLDCRKANTAYTAGAIVACPYHKEFLLKCTTAGTTNANSLDTTSVTKGSVITDGSAKWTVIAGQIIDLAISGKVITVTFVDGTQKTLTTQDTGNDMTDYIVESYRNGTEWYEVYKSGKVRQGGYAKYTGSGYSSNSEQTINLLKPFKDTNYYVSITVDDAQQWGPNYWQDVIVKHQTTLFSTYYTCNKWWIAEGQGA